MRDGFGSAPPSGNEGGSALCRNVRRIARAAVGPAWFLALWLAGVVALRGLAYALRGVIAFIVSV